MRRSRQASVALRIADARRAERLRRNRQAEGSLEGQECRSFSPACGGISTGSGSSLVAASARPNLTTMIPLCPGIPVDSRRPGYPTAAWGACQAATPTLHAEDGRISASLFAGPPLSQAAGRSRCQLAAVEGPGHVSKHVCGEPSPGRNTAAYSNRAGAARGAIPQWVQEVPGS
jgi:hypothetical protein